MSTGGGGGGLGDAGIQKVGSRDECRGGGGHGFYPTDMRLQR